MPRNRSLLKQNSLPTETLPASGLPASGGGTSRLARHHSFPVVRLEWTENFPVQPGDRVKGVYPPRAPYEGAFEGVVLPIKPESKNGRVGVYVKIGNRNPLLLPVDRLIALLSEDEKKRRAQCEAVIRREAKGVADMGRALQAIRDGRLYRDTHRSFKDYCVAVWNKTRQWAYLEIDIARTVALLGEAGVEGVSKSAVGEARVLAGLNPEQAQAVWQLMRDTAPNGKLTTDYSRSVAEFVKDLLASGTVTLDDGRQIPVAELAGSAISAITYERMEQRKAIVEDKVARREAAKNGTQPHEEMGAAGRLRQAFRAVQRDWAIMTHEEKERVRAVTRDLFLLTGVSARDARIVSETEIPF